jgi:NAD(P) transhydrogenase subunit alpha
MACPRHSESVHHKPRIHMIVGVLTETFPGERRVATIPATVPALTKAGLEVLIEPGAGVSAGFLDAAYTDKGARVAGDRAQVFADADVILQVRTLGANLVAGRSDLNLFKSGQTVIGFSEPLGEPQAARDLAAQGVRAFSMELIPRITRAQSMDALSSMATIAGYKAVLLAAETLPRMFPMLMTAAGTITPARVFVVGAGVAGLQAIASARRLGAKVEAYDVRPAVKEQVESLGATFVDLALDTDESEDKAGYAKAQDEAFYARQREMMTRVVAASDVVITTALIPGRPAPVLVTDEMVAGMTPGAVVVDLAAERGGNVEPSKPDETIVVHGVTVLGPTNLPATVPFHASQMYAKNISTLLLHLVDDGAIQIDLDDEITQGTLVSQDGNVVHTRVRELLV